MPNRSRDKKFQVLKVNVGPAKCKQFADPKSSCRIEKGQRALPDRQLAEKKLKFSQFEYVRYQFDFCGASRSTFEPPEIGLLARANAS